jgi:hypothetical protein
VSIGERCGNKQALDSYPAEAKRPGPRAASRCRRGNYGLRNRIVEPRIEGAFRTAMSRLRTIFWFFGLVASLPLGAAFLFAQQQPGPTEKLSDPTQRSPMDEWLDESTSLNPIPYQPREIHYSASEDGLDFHNCPTYPRYWAQDWVGAAPVYMTHSHIGWQPGMNPKHVVSRPLCPRARRSTPLGVANSTAPQADVTAPGNIAAAPSSAQPEKAAPTEAPILAARKAASAASKSLASAPKSLAAAQSSLQPEKLAPADVPRFATPKVKAAAPKRLAAAPQSRVSAPSGAQPEELAPVGEPTLAAPKNAPAAAPKCLAAAPASSQPENAAPAEVSAPAVAPANSAIPKRLASTPVETPARSALQAAVPTLAAPRKNALPHDRASSSDKPLATAEQTRQEQPIRSLKPAADASGKPAELVGTLVTRGALLLEPIEAAPVYTQPGGASAAARAAQDPGVNRKTAPAPADRPLARRARSSAPAAATEATQNQAQTSQPPASDVRSLPRSTGHPANAKSVVVAESIPEPRLSAHGEPARPSVEPRVAANAKTVAPPSRSIEAAEAPVKQRRAEPQIASPSVVAAEPESPLSHEPLASRPLDLEPAHELAIENSERNRSDEATEPNGLPDQHALRANPLRAETAGPARLTHSGNPYRDSSVVADAKPARTARLPNPLLKPAPERELAAPKPIAISPDRRAQERIAVRDSQNPLRR